MAKYRFAYKSARVLRDLFASEMETRPHPLAASVIRKFDAGMEDPGASATESVVVDLTIDEMYAIRAVGYPRELIEFPPKESFRD